MSVVNKINLNGDEYNITDPTAQAAADAANTAATSASTAAAAAQTRADQAWNEAFSANYNAGEARRVADNADNTAQNAATQASTAASVALTANNKADTAISTANTASTTATAANTAAAAAQADVDALELVVADMLHNKTTASAVDLTAYNSTTPYTAPYDGYIRAIVGYGSGNVATVTINNLQETTPCITTASISKITYVKKGMSLYATVTGNATATYLPLDT